jgi:CPA2 family monovalent cation:H+ antiporter-2
MGPSFLHDILIIFVAVIPVVLLTHYLKLPSIVGFLITGAIIGPFGIGFIDSPDRITVLAEVGVALLLFHIGLEFSFENMKGIRVVGVLGGLFQVAATIAAGMGLGSLFGWRFEQQLVLGAAVSLSSTAVVLSVLSSKHMLHSPAGRVSTAILVLQDLAVVPMIIMIKFFAGAKAGGAAMETLAWAATRLVFFAGGLLLFYRYFLCPLLHAVARTASRELFIIVVVGLALGTAWVTESLGLSFALGAFLAGLMVSATEYRFYALTEIGPFRYCFAGLFFVSVGMLVNLPMAANHLPELAMIVAFALLAKFLIATAAVFLFGYPIGVSSLVGLMLAQMGEFSFLVVHVGRGVGLIGSEFYQILISSTLITMVMAPAVIEFAPRLGSMLTHVTWHIPFWRRRFKSLPDEDSLPEGHIIICGFGPLGQAVGSILERRGIPFVVLELNPETTQKLKAKDRQAFLGDGASAELLMHSGIDKARLLAIAVPDYINGLAIIAQARALNPKITIIARSRYRNQVSNFYDAGADIVICEELEGGIEMGRYVLLQLGVLEDEACRFVDELREFGSADFF